MSQISRKDPSLPACGPPPQAKAKLRVGPQAGSVRPRLDSVDWLRGLVMVLMVLDHTRDFLAAGNANPTDIHNTPLFLTRWVTHLCAPTFVFLAGVSAWLYGARGHERSELSRFLLSRGLWLILLEIVVVRFGWTFNLRFEVVVLQVIWAIGVSLVVLSGLIYLPRRLILILSMVLIAGHNLLDKLTAQQMGSADWLGMILHQRGVFNIAGKVVVLVLYPLIPWVGVLAAGYAFGPVMQKGQPDRRKWTLGLGLGLLGLFVVLRATNLYGDPQPWSSQPQLVATLLSFVNCEKYPPSLLYLCMTLGIALMLLSAAEALNGHWGQILVTFGRVPLFFYVAHIFLVHSLAIGWAWLHDGDARWLVQGLPIVSKPPSFGFSLPAIYPLWLAVLALLYPVCLWVGNLKQRRRDWWLSYC